MPDRLTPLDASFLHLENARHHMHVACVMVFAGEAPAYGDFLELVESRLDHVPRYRQRLAEVPLELGRPCWVDDECFDLRYHVRATALPRPGSEYELQVLAGRVFGLQLNRDKPLWEMWLVEGLQDGRFAILSKTHHAVVDGIAGVDILSVLFGDPSEGSGRWRPEPPPGRLELLGQALVERVTQPAELAAGVKDLVTAPLRTARAVGATVVGAAEMAREMVRPAASTPYNRREIGGDRRFTWVRASLDDVKGIKNSLGGTVNDVVLTVVTRALRRHLLDRGEDLKGRSLRVFVPVSVRADDQRGEAGNEVSGMIAHLPVGVAEPATAFNKVRKQMDALKLSPEAVGAHALVELTGFAPATIMHQAGRVAARQRLFNLVVTNVPGPQQSLHFGEHELLDIVPMVPLGGNLALGVAILSYHGRMNFGLVGDFDLLPDLDDVADDFRAALRELAGIAGVRLTEEASLARAPGTAPRPVEDLDTRRAQAVGNGRGGPPSPPPQDLMPGVELQPAEEDEVVAESADEGAAEGVGAMVRIDEPWDGYDRLRAAEIVDRLATASDEELAVVQLYEGTKRKRATVLRAAERELKRR